MTYPGYPCQHHAGDLARQQGVGRQRNSNLRPRVPCVSTALTGGGEQEEVRHPQCPLSPVWEQDLCQRAQTKGGRTGSEWVPVALRRQERTLHPAPSPGPLIPCLESQTGRILRAGGGGVLKDAPHRREPRASPWRDHGLSDWQGRTTSLGSPSASTPGQASPAQTCGP